MPEINSKIYDVYTDSLRDITEADIERFKDMEAFNGIRILMTRALLYAEHTIVYGSPQWSALYKIKDQMLELLDLDMNAKPNRKPE